MSRVEVDPKNFATVCGALVASDAKSATRYLSPKLVVRATWFNKPSGRNSRETMVVTFGAPNYAERLFAKACLKAKEPFPVGRVQFKPWPKKREA
jgi:hypothetical protein